MRSARYPLVDDQQVPGQFALTGSAVAAHAIAQRTGAAGSTDADAPNVVL